MFRSISVPSALSRRPGPLAAGLLLLLALAGAPPAHASLNTRQPITVGSGGTYTSLTLGPGDSVDTSTTTTSAGSPILAAITVTDGGTLNITGGSVNGGAYNAI